jgi:hypothetical protein
MARLQLGASLALVVSGAAQAQATRSRIVVEGLGEVTQIAAVAVTTSGGLEWSF